LEVPLKLLATTTLLVLFSSSVFAQDAAKGAQLFATCVQCHGDQGHGDPAQQAPRIAGQHDWYLLSSLIAFKKGERQNPKMLPFIKNLTEKDFKDLAAYISGLN